jgi:hypothetical protein
MTLRKYGLEQTMACLLAMSACVVSDTTYAAEPEAHAPQSLTLVISIEGSSHRVVSARLNNRTWSAPIHVSTAPDSISLSLLDAEGLVRFATKMPDPRLVRGAMPLPGEPETGHPVFLRDRTAYRLNVPWDSRYSTLRVVTARSRLIVMKSTGRDTAGSGTQQLIDLSAVLAKALKVQ